MAAAGLYIHIPFCDHKCIYCDFYSIITSDNTGNYLSELTREIQYYSKYYKDTHSFDSIYFGGGTPSYMSSGYIARILSSLKENYVVSEDAEITLETNPGTVDKAKLSEFRNAGINRLSVGIQSFDDNDLEFLTRIHSRGQAVDTIHSAVDAGFRNISIDLIFNLPGQTQDKWLRNIDETLALPVTHISAYSLILERGTILNRMVLDGKVTLMDDDHDADLYELTIEKFAGAGFLQYEVSNFCLPGNECRHNLHYWNYDDYLSFGTSAHSFMNGQRWWNISALNLYLLEMAKRGTAVAGSEQISIVQAKEEFIMLAMRGEGLDMKKYERIFGEPFPARFRKFMKSLVARGYAAGEGDFVKLTPRGYAVCDEILGRM